MQIKIVTSVITAALTCVCLSACTTHTPTPALAQVQEAQQIPTAAFFNQSSIGNLKLSSDGRWVAWLQQRNGADNIYVMATEGNPQQAYALTDFKEPVDDFHWSETGTDIFYIQDFNGNENQQIFILKTQDKDTLQVTQQIRLTEQDETNYLFIGQSKNAPHQINYMANYDDKARVDVYQLDLNTEIQTRTLENTLSFMGVDLDDNGHSKVGVTMHSDGSYELFNFDHNQWKGVLRSQPGEAIELIEYNGDKNIAYISTSMGELDKLSLMTVDLNSGSTQLLHQDPARLSDVYNTHFDENGQPLMVSYYYGYKEDYPLNPYFARHWNKIAAHFQQRVEIDLLEQQEKNGKWLLSVASDKDAGSYYFYNEKSGQLKRLLQKDTLLNPALLSTRQSITYQARDGETIQAYLTLPTHQSTNLPTVVIPHGGPWSREHWTLDSGYFNRVAQLLANRGYAVLQPNFRASTGFGERFYNLGNQNWGTGTMQHDVTDGAHYLIKKGIADPKRLGIMGGSYGGYASLAGVTFTPDLYQAAISFCGPSSLVTLMNSFPDYYRPYLVNWYSAVGDPLIPADIENMQSRSPINFVNKITTPLLLVQGANDPRVTQIESDNIARQMHKEGRTVNYILAKDEGHGFFKRSNKLAFILQMELFFAQHLGGKVDPAPSEAIRTHLHTLQVDIPAL